MCNPKSRGGMEVLSFETLNNTFKVKWLLHMINENENTWNTFPKHIFNGVGGIKFLLKCNYKIEKLPIKLSDFHKQALLAWKLIYKHNFSPTNLCIWNNESILYKNKSLFYQKWFDHGIILVSQLLNTEGQLLRYHEFLSKFHLPVSPKEFAVVFDAIPRGILHLLRGSGVSNKDSFNSAIFIEGLDITKKRCSNKYIRNCLQITTLPPGQFFWNSQYGDINWNKAWLVGERFCVGNKVKEVSFKIMHNIYPAKKTLERFKIDMDFLCVFCGRETETIQHLFYKCAYSKIFWMDIQHFIRRITGQAITLQEKDIFIYFENNKMDKDIVFFIQLILLMAKFHIHKKKWTESKPSLEHFIQEIRQYATSIKDSKNNKAMKTNCIFERLNIAPL